MKEIFSKKPLLISSLCMFFCNIPFIVISISSCDELVFNHKLVIIFCTLGIISSILNHSFSNENKYKLYVRWLDRSVMYIGISHYIYYIRSFEQLLYMYIGGSLYILSKLTKITLFHILSHLFAISFHNKMLLSFNNDDVCYGFYLT